MNLRQLSILCALGVAMTFGITSIAAATPPPPDVNPANFVHPIANPNPFFPLVPGTTFIYQGVKEGAQTSNITEVTCKTREILGVTTTEVHDQAFAENGKLVEDTLDRYAQDSDGNVWYFGEATEEKDPLTGEVISTEGSWEAGVDDADAGFIMLANPQVGDRYYEEFARGVAEDQARVQSVNASACIQSGCSGHLLLTKETTRFDPAVVENKYYKPGVGFILGVIVKGGDERTEFVSMTHNGCP
jgi:hypothetical protein